MCVCVCVCTGTSRRLTEGTSGLSGTFFHKIKKAFSLRQKVRSVISLPRTKLTQLSLPFCSHCNVSYTSPFHVRKAHAIMVLCKRMRVRVRRYSMCTHVRAHMNDKAGY